MSTHAKSRLIPTHERIRVGVLKSWCSPDFKWKVGNRPILPPLFAGSLFPKDLSPHPQAIEASTAASWK